MAFYKKKPVTIEAFQLGVAPMPEWVIDLTMIGAMKIIYPSTPCSPLMQVATASAEIKTLEGTMTAHSGDFIIKGIKGEVYPCKPDIFYATYEKI